MCNTSFFTRELCCNQDEGADDQIRINKEFKKPYIINKICRDAEIIAKIS